MRIPDMSVLGAVLVLTSTLAHTANLTTSAQPDRPCHANPYPGPALLTDPSLYIEGHPGTRVIDYGVRLPPDEFQRPLRVECRVSPDTALVAQWIARPPPKGQVAGSIPAQGTKFPLVQPVRRLQQAAD